MITKGTRFGPRKKLIGDRYGRLTVTALCGDMHLGHYMWKCLCDCGNFANVSGNHLRTRNTKSCGCLDRESSAERLRTHGMKDAPEYRVWGSMFSRCRNPKEKCYPRYGGRGIKVCERWLRFENFFSDMGPRPIGLTIERKDNNGDYCPENCVWATLEQQVSNRRNNVILTFNGKTQTQAQWARELGVGHKLISKRLEFGWPIEKILTTLPRKITRRKHANA